MSEYITPYASAVIAELEARLKDESWKAGGCVDCPKEAENKRLRGVLNKLAIDNISEAEDEWDHGWNSCRIAVKAIAQNALKPTEDNPN